MLRVGLTGGLGSGKSTVAKMFAARGVHVISADEVGRTLMQPGEAVYRQIVAHFGPEIVRADGTLDRRRLADLAFREGRLDELNRIVHPAVIAAQEAWMDAVFADDPQAIAMIESAIIFEASASGSVPGWRDRFDCIVLVTAPDAVKIQRYAERMGGVSEGQVLVADARARLAAQIPDAEKAALSDAVIDNSGTLDATEQRVAQVLEEIRDEIRDGIRNFRKPLK